VKKLGEITEYRIDPRELDENELRKQFSSQMYFPRATSTAIKYNYVQVNTLIVQQQTLIHSHNSINDDKVKLIMLISKLEDGRILTKDQAKSLRKCIRDEQTYIVDIFKVYLKNLEINDESATQRFVTMALEILE